ncbi:MAG: UDP binding domain-containing protein, partial [Pseudonocardiaceae bacterium]
AEALNDRGKALNGARILALGVTYKEDVGDIRESSSIQVLARLHRKGARITFHDPFIERIQENGLRIERVQLDHQAFESVDLVALLTPHTVYDLAWIVDRSPLLFDARNAVRARQSDNVIVL